VSTPVGRKLRPKLLRHGDPWIRVKPKDVLAAGVQRVGRITDVRDGLPLTDAGQTVAVANLIWCTGFHPGFSWIDLPVFDERGDPMHERGVVSVEPGLYFLGLRFLYAMTSSTIMGVGRDAKHVVDAIAARARASAIGDLSAAA
jgi:putative flavoprotein involved in K+ transport